MVAWPSDNMLTWTHLLMGRVLSEDTWVFGKAFKIYGSQFKYCYSSSSYHLVEFDSVSISFKKVSWSHSLLLLSFVVNSFRNLSFLDIFHLRVRPASFISINFTILSPMSNPLSLINLSVVLHTLYYKVGKSKVKHHSNNWILGRFSYPQLYMFMLIFAL